MANRVGPKGQVVIQKEIRDRLGVQAGWVALQRVEDGHLVMEFLPPEHDRSLAGCLAEYAREVPPLTDDEWPRILEGAWEAMAEESVRSWDGQK